MSIGYEQVSNAAVTPSSVLQQDLQEGEPDALSPSQGRSTPTSSTHSKFWLQISAVLAVNFLISKLWLSLAYFSNIRPQLYIVCGVIFSTFGVVVLAMSQSRLFLDTWKSLKKGQIGVSFLETLGFAACVCLLAFQWGRGGWEDLFFANQLLILALFLVCVEQHFRNNFFKALKRVTNLDFVDRAGPIEVLRNTGTTVATEEQGTLVTPESLRVDQVYQVECGDLIPVDSVVLAGLGEVLERQLTAKGLSRVKNAGAYVYGGSEVLRGSFLLKVKRPLEDSIYSTCQGQLATLFDEASEQERSSSSGSFLPALGILFVTVFVSIYFRRQELDWVQIFPIAASILFIGVGLRVSSAIASLYRIVVANFFYSGFLAPVHGMWKELATKVRGVLLVDSIGSLDCASVVDVQLADDRVSEAQVYAVLYAMCSLTTRTIDAELVKHVVDQLDEVELFDAQSFNEYGDRGLSAAIEGVEFSFGSEDFLIERGVHLQASDVVGPSSGEVHYLALEEHVVARVEFDRNPLSAVAELRDALQERNVSLECWSAEIGKQELLDSLEARGFDKDSVRGSLEAADIARGLEKSDGFLVDVESRYRGYDTPTFSFFDQLRWEIDPGRVTLFDRTLSAVARAVAVVQSCTFRRRLLLWLVAFSSLACFGAILLGQFGPVAVLAVQVGVLLVAYHLCLRAIEP